MHLACFKPLVIEVISGYDRILFLEILLIFFYIKYKNN